MVVSCEPVTTWPMAAYDACMQILMLAMHLRDEEVSWESVSVAFETFLAFAVPMPVPVTSHPAAGICCSPIAVNQCGKVRCNVSWQLVGYCG